VLPRDDEGVAGVELAQVNELERGCIFPHEACRLAAAHDLAEHARFAYRRLAQDLTSRRAPQPTRP